MTTRLHRCLFAAIGALALFAGSPVRAADDAELYRMHMEWLARQAFLEAWQRANAPRHKSKQELAVEALVKESEALVRKMEREEAAKNKGDFDQLLAAVSKRRP